MKPRLPQSSSSEAGPEHPLTVSLYTYICMYVLFENKDLWCFMPHNTPICGAWGSSSPTTITKHERLQWLYVNVFDFSWISHNVPSTNRYLIIKHFLFLVHVAGLQQWSVKGPVKLKKMGVFDDHEKCYATGFMLTSMTGSKFHRKSSCLCVTWSHFLSKTKEELNCAWRSWFMF